MVDLLKTALKAPLASLFAVTGVLLTLVSFAEFSKANGFEIHGTPGWLRLVVGFLFIAVACITTYVPKWCRRPDFKKGVRIEGRGISILVIEGEIQRLPNPTTNSAVVLPSNTTFVDDCAADRRTALGAYVLEHFPQYMATMPRVLSDRLGECGYVANAGQYAPGTTILLRHEFSKPAHVVVTASTTRHDGEGILSSPQIICQCVQNIFAVTAGPVIDTIFMPILGSGHGGVDRAIALRILLMAALHCSKKHHHVKQLTILVLPRDVEHLTLENIVANTIAL